MKPIRIFLFCLAIVCGSAWASQAADSIVVIADTIPVDTVAEVSSQAASTASILLADESAGFSFGSLLRGLLGMIVLFAIAWVFSSNRKMIAWKILALLWLSKYCWL